MRLIDDRWYSLRDLTGRAADSYRRRMTDEHDFEPAKVAFTGPPRRGPIKAYTPNSLGGWLEFHDGGWRILPCSYARVEQYLLDKYLGGRWFRDNANNRRTAAEKYRYALNQKNTLAVSFKVTPHLAHEHSDGNFLAYRKAGELLPPNSGAGTAGTLVFTGQPSPKKHLEFIFTAGKPDKALPISAEIWRGFIQIHRDTEEWKYWEAKRWEGQRIPVFYLIDPASRDVAALGLAQMFKLPYDRSIHQAVPNPEAHFGDSGIDFTESLFGFARDTENLRSRVSFTAFRSVNDPSPANEVETVLNGPKPTFYPNYIEQRAQNAGRLQGRESYQTLMDREGQLPARIRGWKRYPVRMPEGVRVPPPPPKSGQAVRVRLQPLEAGSVFCGHLRFHNLRPTELGALIWVLTWGGNPSLRHSLGMGKPFGWGQVEIKIVGQAIQRNDGKPDSVELNALAGNFAETMNALMKAWKLQNSWLAQPQMQELLAMAEPRKSIGKNLEHLSLADKEFITAKNAGLILRPYTKQE
jgi:CRISPR-associated protein (TIGR03986 family)